MAVANRLAQTLLRLAALLVLVLLGGRPVHAGPPPAELETPDPDHMRLIWRPASVAWPLAPVGGDPEHADDPEARAQLTARLQQREAMLAGTQPAPSIRGVIEIDRKRAAGVWIAALETVRVRQISGSAPLRFIRGVDGNTAVVESGRIVASGRDGERRWELHQPPGTGAVWSIEADEPTRILIERVEPRSSRYVAVELEYALLEWIAAALPDADMPALLEPSDALPGRLRLDAALGRELLALAKSDLGTEVSRRKQRRAQRKLGAAIEAWRMLAAMAAVDRDRPAVRPYFARDRQRPMKLEGTRSVRLAVDNSRDYRLAESPRSWVIDRKGPGQLRIAARTWAPTKAALTNAELRVHAGGRVIAQIPLSGHQAKYTVDPGTAIPRLEPLVTEAGEPVGALAETTIVLAPGRHEYVVELIGGPALLAIDGASRIEATAATVRGWTPSKRARAAERAVRRGDAPAYAWLELLLAAQTHAPLPMTAADPRFPDLGARSPLLAAGALVIAAADVQLDHDSVAHLVKRVHPWLAALDADPSIDPAVRGELRTRWLALVANHGLGEGEPELAEALVINKAAAHDPITELPVEGLRLLADLLGPTHETTRSPALAVLELARGRAPADGDLRRQTLRLWSDGSRWSRRQPLSRSHPPPPSRLDPDPKFRPVGEWLVARDSPPLDEIQYDNSWLRLEVGEPIRFIAKLGDASVESAGRRKRLIDLHVATPVGDPNPVQLRVDERRWWSPQLTRVQRHRIAVAPGVHEIEIDGPAGTIAWAEIPPADQRDAIAPARLGRLEQMWALSDSIWDLPGPAVSGFVRLELRWPEDLPPVPVRIQVRENGEHRDGRVTETVLFDPRKTAADIEIDRDALPLGDSPWASARHDIVLPIAADTTSIQFEVEGELPIAASLSLRRGPMTRDQPNAKPNPGLAPEHAEVLAGLASLDHDALLIELEALSRTLLEIPDDLKARARRAALLLMIGETGHARADLLWLATWAEREGRSRGNRVRASELLAELDQRFDALIEPREIVVDDPERVAQPELIEPALSAVVGGDRAPIDVWLATWMSIRGSELDDALTRVDAKLAELRKQRRRDPATANIDAQLLLGALTRAHLLSSDPHRAREAGRAYLALYGRMKGSPGRAREPVAVALAGVHPMLIHLADPTSDARDAGLAFGLAREIEPVYGHTSVRRLAFVAALRSDWSRLVHTEDNAGYERLELPVSELEPSPSAEVRDALLVAPWPSGEAEQLRPDRKGVLTWNASPGTVSAELWCRATRPDLAPGRAAVADRADALGSAKLSVRLRGPGRRGALVEREIEVADAELEVVDLPIETRGRHRLEVTLSDDPIWLCSWRTRTTTPPSKADPSPTKQVVAAHRRGLWWTAESRRDVELIVLGPASITIEARAVANAAQPQILNASIERLNHRDALPAEVPRFDDGPLPLATEVEGPVITESRRSFDVTDASTHTLLLTEPVPHRIRLYTDQGRALIRARLRRDRGDIPPPAQVSIRELDIHSDPVAESLDWRTVGPNLPVLARDSIAPIRNRIGTLDMRVTAGLDDLRDVDDLQPRPGLVASVGWHRELVDNALWIGLEAETWLRDRTTPVGGGSLRLTARVPVLGVRLGARVGALAQSFAGQPATSVRVYGFIDRPTWLSRYVLLRPGLNVGWRWQSLDPEQVAAAQSELDTHPRIYLRYIHDHPILVQPELELRMVPLRDLAVWTEAQLIPNSDFRSLDHVNIEVGTTGIARRPRPWVPLWGLSYQASPRFADANRSTFFVRHRIEAEVGLAVWARDTARIAFGVTNRVFLSDIAPLRDVVQIWIRVDAAFGRRMRDYGLREQWFGEPWAPRAWGGDQHQAHSTQGPRER